METCHCTHRHAPSSWRKTAVTRRASSVPSGRWNVGRPAASPRSPRGGPAGLPARRATARPAPGSGSRSAPPPCHTPSTTRGDRSRRRAGPPGGTGRARRTGHLPPRSPRTRGAMRSSTSGARFPPSVSLPAGLRTRVGRAAAASTLVFGLSLREASDRVLPGAAGGSGHGRRAGGGGLVDGEDLAHRAPTAGYSGRRPEASRTCALNHRSNASCEPANRRKAPAMSAPSK